MGIFNNILETYLKRKTSKMEQDPNSEWSRMKALAQKLKSNQIAINKYITANKSLISSFAERMKDPKQLRTLTNPNETENNYNKMQILHNMYDVTGDFRYEKESRKYDYLDKEYLDYEKSQKYSAYMNKFFQTKDKKYFEEALKYNPSNIEEKYSKNISKALFTIFACISCSDKDVSQSEEDIIIDFIRKFPDYDGFDIEKELMKLLNCSPSDLLTKYIDCLNILKYEITPEQKLFVISIAKKLISADQIFTDGEKLYFKYMCDIWESVYLGMNKKN